MLIIVVLFMLLFMLLYMLFISKSQAINLLKNSVLENRGYIQKIYFLS